MNLREPSRAVSVDVKKMKQKTGKIIAGFLCQFNCSL